MMKTKKIESHSSAEPVLDKDHISILKKEFEKISGEEEVSLSTTLEYIENFNDYFLKYPYK